MKVFGHILNLVLLIGLLFFYFQGAAFALYIPSVISAIFLVIFGSSFFANETYIERIAKIKNPDLPPEAVRYCRRLNGVWCLFFLLNICLSLWTAMLADPYIWFLYNWIISYVIMGTLFIVEFFIRRAFKKRMGLLMILFSLFAIQNARALCPEECIQAIEKKLESPETRADFVQTKKISGLKKELISRGMFLYKKGRGVLWRVKEPHEAAYLITDSGIWRADAEGRFRQAGDSSDRFIETFGDMFLSLFQGDLGKLKEIFEIELSDGELWKVSLKGASERARSFVQEIILSGEPELNEITILEESGDKTVIKLLNLKKDLTPDEESVFKQR